MPVWVSKGHGQMRSGTLPCSVIEASNLSAFEIVSASIHDSNENIRYWAVAGLAYLGADETITPLLQVFHDDPSSNIRERAACGLAQSGMLNEKQRRTAVPKLLDFAEDPSLDATTCTWVFQ